jgi:hypothetical protein
VFLAYQVEACLRDGESEIATETATRSLDLADRIHVAPPGRMVSDREIPDLWISQEACKDQLVAHIYGLEGM